MSTMVTPGGLPPKVLTQAILCTDCETDRRPLMFICTYHEGWWDGWEAAHPGRCPICRVSPCYCDTDVEADESGSHTHLTEDHPR